SSFLTHSIIPSSTCHFSASVWLTYRLYLVGWGGGAVYTDWGQKRAERLFMTPDMRFYFGKVYRLYCVGHHPDSVVTNDNENSHTHKHTHTHTHRHTQTHTHTHTI